MASEEQPLVSGITPAYNAAQYITEAIESVLAQTYKAWELIVVDDGSTDGTAEIVKKYAAVDPRILYRYQENQRMASARNAGIAIAKGTYVVFLDADNLFLFQKLEQQVRFMESNPSCGVCYARILHFYDFDKEVLYENVNETIEVDTNDFFLYVLKRNFINVLSVMVRKGLLDHYGSFPQGWWGCDEHYLWVNLAYHKVVFCPLDETVGFLRLHEKEDSRRKEIVGKSAELFLKLLSIFQEKFTPEEKAKYGPHIALLRKKWQKRRRIGRLLMSPFLSRILMPFYLLRRKSHYRLLKDNDKTRAVRQRY